MCAELVLENGLCAKIGQMYIYTVSVSGVTFTHFK